MWSGICRDVHWSIWSLLVLECGQGYACIGVFGVYWYLNVVRDVHWSIWSLLVLECGQECALEYLESTGT